MSKTSFLRPSYGHRDAVAVIVNFESSSFLEECLRCLNDSRLSAVVVVENGSSTAEKLVVNRIVQRFSKVSVLDSRQNLGFGAAVNLAVESLTTRKNVPLLVVNPDTFFDSVVVEILLDILAQNPDSIVGPRIVTGDLDRPKTWSEVPRVLRHFGMVAQRPVFQGLSRVEGISPADTLSGSFMVMFLSSFRELGGFRDDFFLYFEDTDFCLRAFRQGFRLLVALDAVVWHRVGGSYQLGQKSEAFHYFMQRNRIVLFSEELGFWRFFWGPWQFFTIFLIAKALFDSKPLEKVDASLRGLTDGFRIASQQRKVNRS